MGRRPTLFSWLLMIAAGTSSGASDRVSPQDGEHKSAAANESTQARAIYNKWCSECHDDGPGYPGTAALRVKYKGALPAALLQRTDLTPELITYYVRHGFSAMPIFRKTEISDEQLRLLSLYLARKLGPS